MGEFPTRLLSVRLPAPEDIPSEVPPQLLPPMQQHPQILRVTNQQRQRLREEAEVRRLVPMCEHQTPLPIGQVLHNQVTVPPIEIVPIPDVIIPIRPTRADIQPDLVRRAGIQPDRQVDPPAELPAVAVVELAAVGEHVDNMKFKELV